MNSVDPDSDDPDLPVHQQMLEICKYLKYLSVERKRVAAVFPPMDHSNEASNFIKCHVRLIFILFCLMSVMGYSYWLNLMNAGDFFRWHMRTQSSPKDELEISLSRASMGNNTVIVSILNRAYAVEDGMLDLFLRSFQRGKDTGFLLDHLLLVAVDQKSYDRCNLLHNNCYKLVTDGVNFSKEMIYLSPGYLKMMWRRTSFIIEVLKRNYNILFTDMDVVFLRNPFEVLKHKGGGDQDDFQFSCDVYRGNPYSQNNNLNNGFYFVVSNNRTIKLFELLYSKREKAGARKQQSILTEMKNRGMFRELGLKVRFHDVKYFAGFCSNNGGFDDVSIIHANCCRSIKAKLIDLSLVLAEWEGYVNGTLARNFTWPKHKACRRSWSEKLA